MYHGLFACTIYDSHGLELCTIYDSHDIYLCVLWTIYIYKFSRCHAVVFTVFSFHLLIFDKNRRQNSPRNHHADFQEKPANFLFSGFSLFLRCLRCVSAEFFFQVSPISFEFFKIQPIESVRYGFPPSTEFCYHDYLTTRALHVNLDFPLFN
jgi:hypothetical protein